MATNRKLNLGTIFIAFTLWLLAIIEADSSDRICLEAGGDCMGFPIPIFFAIIQLGP